jgi:hypothetical protein
MPPLGDVRDGPGPSRSSPTAGEARAIVTASPPRRSLWWRARSGGHRK